jgi:hypothetical protein
MLFFKSLYRDLRGGRDWELEGMESMDSLRTKRLLSVVHIEARAVALRD